MISVDRFTTSAQEVAQRGGEIMQRYSHNQIDTEHVLLALIEQPQGGISQLLEFLKADANALAEGMDTILRTGPKGDSVEVGPGQVAITPRVVRIIDLAIEESNRLKDELISNEHLFLAIFSEHNTPAARLLEEAGLTHDRVYDAVQQMRE
ncbi:MAG TPA: Clp protease N-terminal domain-containing protein [Anaerolineales bacterium]|nr:Clp protease N-terminal domain-containing protein [Anaerolineales bacterium]